jgi:hypothetical protein
LRQLEYYQGILILTTNMAAQCDPAFESTSIIIFSSKWNLTDIVGRIHFCIKYPDLDLESRKAIWRTFIQRASKNPGDISEGDVDRLAEYKLNGRQVSWNSTKLQTYRIFTPISLDQECC